MNLLLDLGEDHGQEILDAIDESGEKAVLDSLAGKSVKFEPDANQNFMVVSAQSIDQPPVEAGYDFYHIIRQIRNFGSIGYFFRKEIWNMQNILGKYGVNIVVIDQPSLTKAYRALSLKIHPDKLVGKNYDPVEVQTDYLNFQKYKTAISSSESLASKKLESMKYAQTLLYKGTVVIKVFDTGIDTIRFVYKPTLTNIKAVVVDSAYLYGMYSGVNYYSIAITGVEAAYKFYNGEYLQAFSIVGQSIGFMALHYVITWMDLPYLGLVYSATMTAYAGYKAITNAADLCREVGGNEICSILELSATKDESDQELVPRIDMKDNIELSHEALANFVVVEYEWLLLA